jgi:ABC-type thiamin/hydroxymethylpyrimidine transport system permease subunit
VTAAGTRPEGDCRAAVLVVGLGVAFLVAVDAIRFIRADLFLDRDPSWAAARLLLLLLVLPGAAAAGGLAATLFRRWSRFRASREPLPPLALSRPILIGLVTAAVVLGCVFRFVALGRLPPVLYLDEVCIVPPALALEGSWRDFHDPIRFLPVGDRPTAVIGVAYLEAYRLFLRIWGMTVFGLRFHVALAGSLSVVTAACLARSLLPSGGAALAGMALAGLRWSLIVSRFGWNALALAPIADLAAIAALSARRRRSAPRALTAGLVAGAGAYVYLGSWIVAAALGGFLLWPYAAKVALGRRVGLSAAFFGGVLLAASPIFLVRSQRPAPYFARARDQNIVRDMRRTGSWMPPFAVAADALAAPWFIPEPLPRQDLPKSRLGWLVGLPLAVAFLRALRNPLEDLSALLFAHVGAACLASLYWGEPGHPNGMRFAYLTTLTAVGAAAGALWLAGLASPSLRRSAAIAAIGALVFSSFLGARDALLTWADSPATFEAFQGTETLLARAAVRWERYGRVELDPDFHPYLVYQIVHDDRMDPDETRQRAAFFNGAAVSAQGRPRCFRIVPPAASRRDGERRVEVVQGGAGQEQAEVLAQAGCLRP